MTKILKSDENGRLEAAEILCRDGIVALPTETVYGLAGNANSVAALNKIYQAKGRPADNPLIWHVGDAEKAFDLFDLNSLNGCQKKRAELLAKHCWPGPLTMVAKKALHIKSSLPSVAVRVPKDSTTLAILAHINFPLAMPSANLSTRPSPTSALHVLKTLSGRIDAVVDGGVCEGGLESTVLLIDDEKLTILRPGLLSKQMLEDIVDEEVKQGKNAQKTLSPGQAYLHYSPHVPAIALMSPEVAQNAWNDEHTIIARKSDEAWLRRKFGMRHAQALTLILPDEPEGFAMKLYNALYEAESRPKNQLALIAPPTGEEWVAVLDRLARSAGAKGVC